MLMVAEVRVGATFGGGSLLVRPNNLPTKIDNGLEVWHKAIKLHLGVKTSS